MTKGSPSHNLRHRLIETFPNVSAGDPASHNASIATQPSVPTSSLSSPSSSSSVSLTTVGSLIIVGLFIVLALSLWYIVWSTLRYYRQRKLRRDIMLMGVAHLSGSRGPDVNGEENQPWYEDDSAALQRVQRRYETIEHWTITKRAQEHTTCCNIVQVQRCSNTNNNGVTPSTTAKQSISAIITDEEMNHQKCESDSDSADIDNDHECPICMSKFEAGQILSWSSNPKCIHVYHHECIKEWLLRHKECCLCKQIYIPIDAEIKHSSPLGKSGTIPNYINELSQQFRTSAATSYYCLDHGLVRIPETFYCTQSELEQLEHLIIDNTISPVDLISFRGNYHEYETIVDNQLMESSPSTNAIDSAIVDTVQENDTVIPSNDDQSTNVEPMEIDHAVIAEFPHTVQEDETPISTPDDQVDEPLESNGTALPVETGSFVG